MSLSRKEEIWMWNFDQIEKDYDNLVEWWEKNKHCTCDSEENGIFCSHFNQILKATMGKRIQESWDEKLQIGFRTINEVMKK